MFSATNQTSKALVLSPQVTILRAMGPKPKSFHAVRATSRQSRVTQPSQKQVAYICTNTGYTPGPAYFPSDVGGADGGAIRPQHRPDSRHGKSQATARPAIIGAKKQQQKLKKGLIF